MASAFWKRNQRFRELSLHSSPSSILAFYESFLQGSLTSYAGYITQSAKRQKKDPAHGHSCHWKCQRARIRTTASQCTDYCELTCSQHVKCILTDFYYFQIFQSKTGVNQTDWCVSHCSEIHKQVHPVPTGQEATDVLVRNTATFQSKR